MLLPSAVDRFVVVDAVRAGLLLEAAAREQGVDGAQPPGIPGISSWSQLATSGHRESSLSPYWTPASAQGSRRALTGK